MNDMKTNHRYVVILMLILAVMSVLDFVVGGSHYPTILLALITISGVYELLYNAHHFNHRIAMQMVLILDITIATSWITKWDILSPSHTILLCVFLTVALLNWSLQPFRKKPKLNKEK